MPEGLSFAQAAAALREVGAQLLVRGWLSANNIVFRGEGDLPATVVDTGYVNHGDQTLALIGATLGDKPLSRIVNTHLHSDHCGGNALLCRTWPDVRISVPAGYRSAVAPWDEALLSYRLTGQACEPFPVDDFLQAGGSVALAGRDWQVHAAPGHDPDAVVLFEPQSRVLISGDALWANRLAIVFPALSGEGGFKETRETLDIIERLAPRVVLPGHGDAFTDIAGAIAQSRARLEAFERDPDRHRQHAVRALVVYHMLDVTRAERADLIRWIASTPIFQQAFGCLENFNEAEGHARVIVARLVSDGVLQATGSMIHLPNL